MRATQAEQLWEQVGQLRADLDLPRFHAHAASASAVSMVLRIREEVRANVDDIAEEQSDLAAQISQIRADL